MGSRRSPNRLTSLRGRIGGLALASQRDPREYTAAARRSFLARFEHQVDPDHKLSEAERTRRAETLVETLSAEGIKGQDGKRYPRTPKGMEVVRRSLLRPGQEGEPQPLVQGVVSGLHRETATTMLPREGQFVDVDGRPVKLEASTISAPGGFLASPSDVISINVGRIIAHPTLLAINEALRQIEFPFLLPYKAKGVAWEERHARIIFRPPPDWGEEFTDPILEKLLNEAHNMDREDLLLYALIMNELPRHGQDGFTIGLDTIRRAKGRAGNSAPYRPEDLVDFHRRLHRLARIAVYAPSNVFISGRYFKGTPF